MNYSSKRRVEITEVKVNGKVVWKNPSVIYNQMIDETETKLLKSDFKESQEVIRKLMEKK